MLTIVELIAQWVNAAFFVIPNAVLLARPCSFFSELVGECCSPAAELPSGVSFACGCLFLTTLAQKFLFCHSRWCKGYTSSPAAFSSVADVTHK